MRYLFYKIGLWIRDSRRTGYLQPILITASATAAAILLFKVLESRLFPGATLWQSRISGMVFSSALAGLMAYVALRLYRQMAQETIDELTERLRLSEELLGERNLIKSLMETAVDRIYFKDLDGRYIRASASVAASFGLAGPAEVIGQERS
jgi:PAS domain-containing protein